MTPSASSSTNLAGANATQTRHGKTFFNSVDELAVKMQAQEDTIRPHYW